jgi:hypothetical protein
MPMQQPWKRRGTADSGVMKVPLGYVGEWVRPCVAASVRSRLDAWVLGSSAWVLGCFDRDAWVRGGQRYPYAPKQK